MRSRLLLLTLVLLLAAVTAATATEDLLGLYFDSDAQSQCREVSELTPGAAFNLHMILQNATQPAVYGFDAAIEVQPNLIGLLEQDFPTTAISTGLPFSQIVGYAEPLPTGTATVLVTFTIFYTGLSEESVCITLTGTSSDYPTIAYQDGQQVQANVAVSPYGPSCTAEITTCTVGTESLPFDTMKALYR